MNRQEPLSEGLIRLEEIELNRQKDSEADRARQQGLAEAELGVRNIVVEAASLLARLAQGRHLCALEVSERFYEIGSPQGLAELGARLRQS
jgi:hypothetical protein